MSERVAKRIQVVRKSAPSCKRPPDTIMFEVDLHTAGMVKSLIDAVRHTPDFDGDRISGLGGALHRAKVTATHSVNIYKGTRDSVTLTLALR